MREAGAAVSVNLLLPLPGEAMVASENAGVTPFGTPVTESATAELKPFTRAVEMLTVAVPPGATLAVAGEVSVKLGVRTVRLIVCVWVTFAPDAVTVRAYVPGAVEEAAASVNLLLPLPGATRLEVAKVAATPVGAPDTESTTAELKPFEIAVDSVTGTEPPGATLGLAELAVNVKFGVNTVRFTVCVFVTPLPVAETVIGYTPGVGEEDAASVNLLLPLPGDAMLAGANVAVTPVGAPLAESVSAELKPVISVEV